MKHRCIKKKLSLLCSFTFMFSNFGIINIIHAEENLIVPMLQEARILAYETDFEDENVDYFDVFSGEPTVLSEDGNKFYLVQNYDYINFPHANELKNFDLEFNMKFKASDPDSCWPAFYIKSLGVPNRYELFFELSDEKKSLNLRKNSTNIIQKVDFDLMDLEEQWIYMKISVKGNNIDVYINDKDTPILSCTDNEMLTAGPMGFVQGGCEYYYVDNVLVSVPVADTVNGQYYTTEDVNPYTPNTLGGVIIDSDFENHSIEPFKDEDGKSSIIDYNNSSVLSVNKSVVLGDSNWKNYSVEFDMTMINRKLTGSSFEPLYIRYTDDNNSYVGSFSDIGNTISINKINGGASDWVGNVGIYLGKNTTKKYRIDVMDDKLAFYIKNTGFPNFEYPSGIIEDSSIASGGIKFVKPDCLEALYIDNLKVCEIDKNGDIGPEISSTGPLFSPKPNPASSWADINGHWAEEIIKYAAAVGNCDGVSVDSFAPDKSIRITEFIKLLLSSKGYKFEASTPWYKPYIDKATELNLITSDISNNCDRPATRYEVAQIIYNLVKNEAIPDTQISLSDIDNIPSEYKKAVENIAKLGIITGYEDDSFRGNNTATRSEALVIISNINDTSRRISNDTVTVALNEYKGAFKNPLKGFCGGEYVTIERMNFAYDSLESSAEDGVDKIISECNEKWADYPALNKKVIPSVIIEWPGDPHWPSDMTKGDYTSEQFQERIDKFIRKLGRAWDNDPRVAFVQTSLIGWWGEMQNPYPSLEVQDVMGKAFTESFKNKKVMTNVIVKFSYFDGCNFGVTWDSFAHPGNTYVYDFYTSKENKDMWKKVPNGGETAFDWGSPLGADPTQAVLNYSDKYIEAIKATHSTFLSWLNAYKTKNPKVLENAAEIQKNFGYRYVLNNVRYTKSLNPGDKLNVDFSVTNKGSAPMYYNWPVQINLLDKNTHEVVWNQIFDKVDIRNWLPEDNYSYLPLYTESGEFKIPETIANGEYILALSVLDPEGGMVPSLRFANSNYFNGGYHPIGYIGIGVDNLNPIISNEYFDDIKTDNSLYYIKLN